MNGGASYLAAAITAAVTVLLWVASRAVEFYLQHRKLNDDKEKFIRALYAEIDFNTSDMEEFIQNPVSLATVIAKIKSDQSFIPHVTDSRHTEIYKSNIELINYAGDGYISDVVYFYGLLERIKGQIDGVYLPSYVKISGQGRANVLNRIYDDCYLSADAGRAILREMEISYPSYKFVRKKRKAPNNMSDAELKAKYDDFALDLDRVRATHAKTS
ncbi:MULTISPECIES: hypothetical protein [unclassified Ensifer]|uniref:hypothetical protein n=1 Tax=unclassified Ensifer TaxID=2633371 RepID=UPI00081304D2|nr:MULTISPECIES: hypothetical protein [unclassified Ensifer]OCP01756.1 hypothetical protein BC362_21300 [Ensifer sp. LC14]OCP09545.1 hypothetical protein BC374_03040 [Ensifer sp. LC13]OCP10715.1 hypothetical protein BBX50_03380 [Ensifer sp. LC11]OCP32793.1 hypothetical protein BC364_03040 [Ensifer sp. LC499]